MLRLGSRQGSPLYQRHEYWHDAIVSSVGPEERHALMRHLSLASPHSAQWVGCLSNRRRATGTPDNHPCLCVEQVLSCMNDDTTVVARIRCSINRPLFLSIVAVHVLPGSGSAATEARQPPGNNSEDINVRSGGKPISHLRQSRLAPSFEVRPCAVTTQGRFVHGGLCRTCWWCPHASSATQSFSLSRWKPTMGCSKTCEPRACYFSASSIRHRLRRSAGSLWAIARMCPSGAFDCDRAKIAWPANRRTGFPDRYICRGELPEPASADRMWTLRMQ